MDHAILQNYIQIKKLLRSRWVSHAGFRLIAFEQPDATIQDKCGMRVYWNEELWSTHKKFNNFNIDELTSEL